ncbi:unnamed protein product [Alopecurus aequalis]
MRLIENARARAATYAKRTKGLQKKAWELSKLCEIPGVLDRYRGAAVQPDTRAPHTHRSYLEAELGKETAKLARVRHRACPGALADWDPAFNDMTLDEAREVLETIDGALRAAGDRMVALGLPAEGNQVALAPDDDASYDAAGVPRQLGLEDVDYAGFPMQMVPSHGAVDETQAPASYDNNAVCDGPGLTMCYADDGSCLPAGYYNPKFVDGTLAPEHYAAQVVPGGDYIDTLPLQYPMGIDANFTNLVNSYSAQWQAEEFQRSETNSSMDENYAYLDNSYAAHWQAEFQRSDTGIGQYQYQCSDPGTRSSSQIFQHGY